MQEDLSATLSTSQTQTLFQPAPTACQSQDPRIVCLSDDNAKAAVDEDMCGSLKCGGSAPMVTGGYAVRRLTPVECERLQGFPDNWTRIEWNGKPEEQCPNGRRYKAIGNSMAVPVMRWIGEGIALVGGDAWREPQEKENGRGMPSPVMRLKARKDRLREGP